MILNQCNNAPLWLYLNVKMAFGAHRKACGKNGIGSFFPFYQSRWEGNFAVRI